MDILTNPTGYIHKYATDLQYPQLKIKQPMFFWSIGIAHVITLAIMPVAAVYVIWLTFKMKVLHRNLLNLIRVYLLLHILASPLRAIAIVLSIFDQHMQQFALPHALSIMLRNIIFLTVRALLVAFAFERFIASARVDSYEKSKLSIIWIFLVFLVVTIGIVCSVYADAQFLPYFSGITLLVTGTVFFIFYSVRTRQLRQLRKKCKGCLPLGMAYQIEENWKSMKLVLIFGLLFMVHYGTSYMALQLFDPEFLMFSWYVYAQSSFYSLLSTLVPVFAIKKYREFTMQKFFCRTNESKVAPNEPVFDGEQFSIKLKNEWSRAYYELHGV